MRRMTVLACLLFSIAVSSSAAVPASQRDALLRFFNGSGGSGWTDNTGWGGAAGTECNWYGLQCNNEGTSITSIEFVGNNLTGLPVDALVALPDLRSLYLLGNPIGGTFPAGLTQLTSLVTLSLGASGMTGPLPVNLGDLRNLEYLELDDNEFSGPIPSSISQMQSLRNLTMPRNQLTGTIPPELGALPNLDTLIIGSNQLTGTIPASFGSAPKLELLYAGDNQFSGALPTDITRAPVLESLYLDGNQFSGSIPAAYGDFPRMVFLSLSRNQLTGTIPTALGNLKLLQQLDLSANQLSGSLPDSLGQMAELRELYLFSNQLTGTLPNALGSLAKLEALVIGANQLSGAIPASFGQLRALKYLSAWNNGFTGTLPDELAQLTELIDIDFSASSLTGTLPPSYSAWTKVEHVSFYGNRFSGTLPSTWGGMSSLRVLGLGRNQLSGSIPSEWSGMRSIREFEAAENQLSGEVPEWLFTAPDIGHIFLAVNRFTGSLPSKMSTASSLVYLDVSGNLLSGSLPDLGALQKLEYLHLNDNNLSGSLPPSFGTLSSLLDVRLERNDLSGPLPPLGGLHQITGLFLHTNSFTGTIPSDIGSLTTLVYLALGANRLDGTIPAAIGSLRELIYLDLTSNQFVGPAPRELMNLTQLIVGGGLFDFNMLFTTDSQLAAFMAARQGTDWTLTQTVPPTNLRVVSVTDRSAVLAWNLIPYVYDDGGYIVTATRDDGTSIRAAAAWKGSDTLIIRGLQPSTRYTFTVRAMTHPHDSQQSTLISSASQPVTASTTVRQLAPAEVSVSAQPRGLVMVGGQPRNSDSFTVTNNGDVATDIRLVENSTFFDITPREFNIGPGASVMITLTALSVPLGSYQDEVIADGVGVADDFYVEVRLVSVNAPTANVEAVPVAPRVDFSGDPGSVSSGVVSFRNSGTAPLTGIVLSDAPWIIVPATLVVIEPADTASISVTIDRRKRLDVQSENGSVSGTVQLLYADAVTNAGSLEAARVASAVPPGFSISVITVIDTAKAPVGSGSVPPLVAGDIAFYLPGAAKIERAGSRLITDVTVGNTFGSNVISDLKLFFSSGAATATNASFSGIKTGESLNLGNVVSSVFGISAVGTVQVRTSSWDKITVGGRMFNTARLDGLFGTSLAFQRSDRSIRAAGSGALVGIRKSGGLHTDLTLQEVLGLPTTVRITFHDVNGVAVASRDVALQAFATADLPDSVPTGAISATLSNVGPGAGGVVAQALVFDEASGDLWNVTDWRGVAGVAVRESQRVLLAMTAGGSASGRPRPVRRNSGAAEVTSRTNTDLYLFNDGTQVASGRLIYTASSGATVVRQVTAPPKGTLVLADVTRQQFSRSGSERGSILYVPDRGSMHMSARVTTTTGTYSTGSSVPIASGGSGLRSGQSHDFGSLRSASSTNVKANTAGTFNSALSLVETAGAPVTVRATLLFSAGRDLASAFFIRDFSVPAHGVFHVDDIATTMIGSNRETRYGDMDGYTLRLQVTDGNGAIEPLVELTENATGDLLLLHR